MKFSRRSLVQNAGIVAGAGLLGLGTGATGQSPARGNGKPRASRSSATATTMPITFE